MPTVITGDATLKSEHIGSPVYVDSIEPCTITIAEESDQQYTAGAAWDIWLIGDGPVTIQSSNGVFLNREKGGFCVLNERYRVAVIVRFNKDVFFCTEPVFPAEPQNEEPEESPTAVTVSLNSYSPRLSETLAVNIDGLRDIENVDKIQYEWMRDREPIRASNFRKHPMIKWDVGRRLSARVDVIYKDGTVESFTSPETEVIVGEENDSANTQNPDSSDELGEHDSAYQYLNDAPAQVAPQLYPEHKAPRVMLTETKSRPSNSQNNLRPILGKYDVYGAKQGDFRNIAAHQEHNPSAKYHLGFSPRAYQGDEFVPHGFWMGFPFEYTGEVTQAESRPYTVFAGHWQYCQHTTIENDIGAEENATFSVEDESRLIYRQAITIDNPWVVIYDAPLGSFKNAEHCRIKVKNGNRVTIDNRGHKSDRRSHGAGSIIAMHQIGQTRGPGKWAWGISTESAKDGAGRTAQKALARFLHLHCQKDTHGNTRSHKVDGQYSDADAYFISRSNLDLDYDGIKEPSGIDENGVAQWGMGLDEFYKELRTLRPDWAIIGGYYTSRGYEWNNGLQLEGWPTEGGEEDFTDTDAALAAYGHDGGNDGFDAKFQIYMAQHLPRPNGQAMYSECLSRSVGRTYSFGKQPAQNDASQRLGLAAALMGDGYYGLENHHDMDPWLDEFSVMPDGRCVNGSMDPNATHEVLKHKGWLGDPLGRHERVFTKENPKDLFAPEKNLIRNGLFDNNLTGWTASNCNIILDTEDQISGETSLKMTGHAPSFQRGIGGAKIESEQLTLPPGEYTACFAVKSPDYRGAQVRLTWINGRRPIIITPHWSRVVMTFYIEKQESGRMSFEVGGEDVPMWLDEVYLFTGNANVMRRDYENGTVWCNATRSQATVDVGTGIYKRLLASGKMLDNSANTGEDVNGTVMIPPYDGLFLIRR